MHEIIGDAKKGCKDALNQNVRDAKLTLSLMFTSAPWDTNNSTSWILPFSAALCNGVIPDYKIILVWMAKMNVSPHSIVWEESDCCTILGVITLYF